MCLLIRIIQLAAFNYCFVEFCVIFCLQPEKVKFELKLGQSKPIYNAFKAIKESPDWDKLSDARKRIVECEYYTFCKFLIFLSFFRN